MADVVFFPRFVLGRTDYGTTVYWDKRLGLLLKTETPPSLRAADPDELRRGYPVIWATWVRFAAMFPQTELPPGPVGSGGEAA